MLLTAFNSMTYGWLLTCSILLFIRFFMTTDRKRVKSIGETLVWRLINKSNLQAETVAIGVSGGSTVGIQPVSNNIDSNSWKLDKNEIQRIGESWE